MTTGEKIRELRKSLGMTQEELGSKIGVQKAAINKYETGAVVNLKRDTLHRLAKALCVSPVVLLGEVDDFTPDERLLIEKYRAADPGTRAAIRKLLDIPERKTPAIGQSVI